MESNQVRSGDSAAIKPYVDVATPLVDAMSDIANNQPPPAHIYHYTNAASLQKILASGEFWCSGIAHMNDTSELIHGTSYARRCIEEAAKRGGEFARFAPPLLKTLDEPVRDLAQFFIGSFSHARDDLCQWRAYGDDARGYMLGFDRAQFEEVAKVESGIHLQSFHLSYDDAPLKALHTRLVDTALQLVPTIATHMGALAMELASDIVRTALLFKHSAYRNEQEYRLIEIHAKGAPLGNRHRERKRDGTMVPAVAINWRDKGRSALTSIMIGPAANEARAREVVNSCLQADGFHVNAVNVSKSPIPFRT